MRRILPSLDLLRGFEAAARHLSFTEAANELFVTQSAISRQIQALEADLGVQLFWRRHRSIVMSEAGQQLFRTVSQVLRDLEDTAERIRNVDHNATVTVSCTLGFASLWLVPRLAHFNARHAQVDLRISASNQIIDLDRDRVEVAIRYCPPASAPADAVMLFGEEGLPVCSKVLVERAVHPLRRPEDLQYHTLLHLEIESHLRPTIAWPLWLEMAQVSQLKPAGSLRFSHYDQLITAALEGQGVALTSAPLVQRMLADQRLVAPFAQRLASPRAYHLVIGARAHGRSDVQKFVDWLLAEAKALPPMPMAMS